MEVVSWRERDRDLRVKAQVGGQTGGGRDSWIEEEDKISDSEWRNRWMIRQKEESWVVRQKGGRMLIQKLEAQKDGQTGWRDSQMEGKSGISD